jgi:two-component system LytT family sensor kinase
MKLRIVFQHLLFWMVYILYETTIGYFGGLGITPLGTLLAFIVNTGVFYAISYCYSQSKKRIKNAILLLLVMLCEVVIIIGISIIFKIFVDIILDKIKFGDDINKERVTTLIMRSIYFVIMGLAYAVFREVGKKERKVIILEKKALQAELNVIKSQINPHFVFNTLGFLYAETYKKLPEVGQSIITLSNIMRYALTKNEDGYSSLESELNYIKDFIKIHESRSKAFFMKISIESVATPYKVVSLVLITLIENMFKHGIFNQNTKEAALSIAVEDGKLIFYSLNYKNNNSVNKVQSNGIGLNYIRERLTDEYGLRGYELLVNETHNSYECKLTMPLKYHESN